MYTYEPTINTLEQLANKIADKHYGDIEYLEDEDERYTVALDTAIKILKAFGSKETSY